MFINFYKEHLGKNLILLAGITVLLVVAAQYPLTSSYPMGGDAPSYMRDAKKILSIPQYPENIIVLTNSWYPLSQILFLPMTAIPIEWQTRFIIWAFLAQVSIGVSLGYLGLRIWGKNVAGTIIAFWGVTPIVATRHFEDGTIAQLWSYVFLPLCIERIYSNKPWSALLLFFATFFAHPVTGFALLIALACAVFPLWIFRGKFEKERRHTISIIFTALLSLGIIGITLLRIRHGVFTDVKTSTDIRSPFDHFHTVFAPIIYLSLLGFFLLLSRKKELHMRVVWVSTMFSFLLLSANGLIGINIWAERVDPLFVLIICIFAAIGWIQLIKNIFSLKILQRIVSIIFFTILLISAWHNNKPVYAFYESSSRYARIHKEEIAAMKWMKTNLPENSTIYSSTENRHSEWIPILTNHAWEPIEIPYLPAYRRIPPVKEGKSFATFFLNREGIPEVVKKNPADYPTIYASPKVIIVKLEPNYKQNTNATPQP